VGRPRRRLLLFRHRRALLAHLGVAVPAGGFAEPVAAAPALVEERPDLLHRPAQRGVVLRSADRALDLVSAFTRSPEQAAHQVARSPQQAPRHAEGIRLEGRHEAVAAALAEELELEPLIGRQVLVVLGELDGGHVG
jgi:hypothetical protein